MDENNGVSHSDGYCPICGQVETLQKYEKRFGELTERIIDGMAFFVKNVSGAQGMIDVFRDEMAPQLAEISRNLETMVAHTTKLEEGHPKCAKCGIKIGKGHAYSVICVNERGKLYDIDCWTRIYGPLDKAKPYMTVFPKEES